VGYLLKRLSDYTGVQIAPSEVLATYGGLRPLLATSDASPSKISRDFATFETQGLIVVTGGKLTTFRAMARRTIDGIMKKWNRHSPCKTHQLDLFAPHEEGDPRLLRLYGSEA